MATVSDFEYLFSVDVPPDVYNSMKDKIKLIVRGKTGDCDSKYVGGTTNPDGSKDFTYRWLCVDGDDETGEQTLILGLFLKDSKGKNLRSEFEVRTIDKKSTKRALDIRKRLVEEFSGKLDIPDPVKVDKIVLGEGDFCSTFEAVVPVEICYDNPDKLTLVSRLISEFRLYPKFAYYAIQKYSNLLTREKHPIVFVNKFSKEELDLYELDYSRVSKMFETIKGSGLYDK